MLPEKNLQGPAPPAADAAANKRSLPLNITRLAPEYTSSSRLSVQTIPSSMPAFEKGYPAPPTSKTGGMSTMAHDYGVTQHTTPSLSSCHHDMASAPSSSSHHTPTTPTFDLSSRHCNKAISPHTMSRLSSPGAWRDSRVSTNFRDSMVTVTSSHSFNIRELPEVCTKFPLPPPKEVSENGSTASLNSTLVASASQTSVVTDATDETSRPSETAVGAAVVRRATIERVPVARSRQVRQVPDASQEYAPATRISLVSTETGESVGWMSASVEPSSSSRPNFSSDPQNMEQLAATRSSRGSWFPFPSLAPVWGSSDGPSGGPDTYEQLGSTTSLHRATAAGQTEADAAAASAEASTTSTFSGSVDQDGLLTARAEGAMSSQTRQSLAAWDEDMPMSAPSTPAVSMFDTTTPNQFGTPPTNYSTPIASPPMTHSSPSHRSAIQYPSNRNVNPPNPWSRYPQVVPGREEGQSRARSSPRGAGDRAHPLVSHLSLASTSVSSAMADYDSDGSDASDDAQRGDASPFGRTSFGCDDDESGFRAQQLRQTFFANPAASRSHTSLASVEGAKTPTRAGTRSLRGSSVDLDVDPGVAGLRSAVLTQPKARYSVESLHEAARKQAVLTHDVPLRKKSLSNLLRKREEERRSQSEETKRLPPLPPSVEVDEEYYVDKDPSSVFNVCNEKYLRKTLLSPPEPEIDEVFDVWRPPSQRRLWEAGTCSIRNEEGELIPFSDLFPTWDDAKPNGPTPRTILIFLRHFWCGPCQDYTLESISTLDPRLLAAHNVRVYVIGSGHWKLLKPYRTLFKCPFPFFTDGPRRLYQLLGMIKYASMLPYKFPFRDTRRAGYNHRPLMKQAIAGFKNAFLHMPIAYPGHWNQLGGEFVLSPGYRCEFSHRMTTMTNHMEGFEVVRHIGINHPHPQERKVEAGPPTKQQEEAREEIDRLTRELRQWQDDRDAELKRMRNKRSARRGGMIAPSDDKAFRRLSATSTWSGYVRTVLRDEAAAELSHMPEIPAMHKKAVPVEDELEHPVVTIGPEVVTIGPESEYVNSTSDSAGPPSSAGTLPDLVDSHSQSTGAATDDSVCSRACSLDPEVSATFGGIAGSPVEPEHIDPAEMERRFAAAMAAARGQERTAAALNNRWSMLPQLPPHTSDPAGEVGVAY